MCEQGWNMHFLCAWIQSEHSRQNFDYINPYPANVENVVSF